MPTNPPDPPMRSVSSDEFEQRIGELMTDADAGADIAIKDSSGEIEAVLGCGKVDLQEFGPPDEDEETSS